MANVSTLKKGGATGFGIGNGYSPQIVHHEIDIAKAVAAGLATTEYVVVATIPANTYLRLLQVEVVTAPSLGAGARIDVGDSASATRFVNNATTLTAGTDLTLANQTGTVEVYPSANELRMTVTGGTIASGVIRFVFLAADTSRVAAATTQA